MALFLLLSHSNHPKTGYNMLLPPVEFHYNLLLSFAENSSVSSPMLRANPQDCLLSLKLFSRISTRIGSAGFSSAACCINLTAYLPLLVDGNGFPLPPLSTRDSSSVVAEPVYLAKGTWQFVICRICCTVLEQVLPLRASDCRMTQQANSPSVGKVKFPVS